MKLPVTFPLGSTDYTGVNSLVSIPNQTLYSNMISFNVTFNNTININSVPYILILPVPTLNIFNNLLNTINLLQYANSYMQIQKIIINTNEFSKKDGIFGFANSDTVLQLLLSGANEIQDYYNAFTIYKTFRFYNSIKIDTENIVMELNIENMSPSQLYNTISGQVLLSKYNPFLILQFDYAKTINISVYMEGNIYPNINAIINMEDYVTWINTIKSI